MICDNALISGMALGRQPVNRAIVLEVCQDLRLTSGEEHTSAATSVVAQDERRDTQPAIDGHDQRAVSVPARAGRIFE